MKQTLPILEEGYQSTNEVGDFGLSSLCAMNWFMYAFLAGLPLADIFRQAIVIRKTFKRFSGVWVFDIISMGVHNVLKLTGTKDWQKIQLNYETEKYEKQLASSKSGLFELIYAMELICGYILGQHKEALKNAEKVRSNQYFMTNKTRFRLAVFYFYDSLNQLALLKKEETVGSSNIFSRVEENQKAFSFWLPHCPFNLNNKYELVEAELFHAKGNQWDAFRMYEQAIKHAEENGFIHEEAIANELAGDFCLRQGMQDLARVYIRKAIYLYDKWGANVKVKLVNKKYTALLSSKRVVRTKSDSADKFEETSSTSQDGSMDWMSLVKASRALSGEIELCGLITKLMHVVMESAGADQAILLLDKSGTWCVEAIESPEKQELVMEGQPLEEIIDTDIPVSIIKYIIRTQNEVLLHNACTDGKFTDDPHIKQKLSKSVLGLPIVHQGHLLGIFILQNYQIVSVFTEDRLQVLRTLTAQAATSLENVRIYEELRQLNRELEQRVQERTEELSIAKEEADKANQSKSVFLANMSHELRTPLNAIIGFSDILRSSISNPKHKDYFDRIRTSGGSLLTLINEILDLSKIESGKMELEYSVVSLTNMFNEIKLLFEQKTYETGVELIVNISSAIPEALLLDGKRIRQILINLLGNAVKFTEDGSITLTADCKYLDYQAKSVIKLNISVADTGVGIPEDQQSNIFDAFEQVKGQSTDKYGGTGLGLAITKRIAEAMGGSLTLESVVGRGSTFIVEIKEVEVATVSGLDTGTDENFDFKAINFEPARVLIVDDIDYNRDLLKSYLEGYGFELNEASNG
ncbi:MAG: GAF domain-containing protein, partial [Planctomycetota bacterium]